MSIEGPINNDESNNRKDRLPYPWNQEMDHEAFDRAKLKNEFLNPFDDEEVIVGFNEPLREMEDRELTTPQKRLYEVYNRVYGDLVYQVLRLGEKDSRSVDLFFTLSEEGKIPKSELVFRSLDSPMGERGFNLAHRIVGTQKEGIGGSAFLKKAEDYLAILKKNNQIECGWIAVDCAQPNVTEFFLKNGYRFLTGGNTVYEKYLSNPEAFKTIMVDFVNDPGPRDPYPVLKEAFDDPEFMSHITEINGKKKLEIDFHHSKKFEKYFPNVMLGKDM